MDSVNFERTIVRRVNLPETNSSSSHALVLSPLVDGDKSNWVKPGDSDWDILLDEEGYVITFPNEDGDAYEVSNSPYRKMMFALTHLISSQHEDNLDWEFIIDRPRERPIVDAALEMLSKVVCSHANAKGIDMRWIVTDKSTMIEQLYNGEEFFSEQMDIYWYEPKLFPTDSTGLLNNNFLFQNALTLGSWIFDRRSCFSRGTDLLTELNPVMNGMGDRKLNPTGDRQKLVCTIKYPDFEVDTYYNGDGWRYRSRRRISKGIFEHDELFCSGIDSYSISYLGNGIYEPLSRSGRWVLDEILTERGLVSSTTMTSDMKQLHSVISKKDTCEIIDEHFVPITFKSGIFGELKPINIHKP